MINVTDTRLFFLGTLFGVKKGVVVFSLWVLLGFAVWEIPAQAQAASAFQLTWQYTQDATNPATAFALQRCVSSGTLCTMTDLAGAAALPLTTLTYTDTTIAQNVTFCYRVSATNSFGRGPYSSTICGKLGSPPGTSPINLQLNIVTVP